MEKNYHYQVIARALEYLHAHQFEQPNLEQIASAQNMSASHFQRLFTEWVGVSPKRYLEHLTLSIAKDRLLTRVGTMQSAHESGLSGSSRLYDLFIKWEAVTPGEFTQGGQGLVFGWGQIETPFGDAIAIANDRGLAALGFITSTADAALYDLSSRWPNAQIQHSPERIQPYADTLGQMQGDLPVYLRGTPFQIAVWRALLNIPTGELSTYSQIANTINKPKAQRAVGSAVGRNPISWIIPCHRVIRESGALGGYHWGLPIKQAILTHESARHDNRAHESVI